MKVGIVTGSFDLLHAGHIHFLKQCKLECDKLIVALHVDPSIERSGKNKPIESVLERQIKLMGTKYVTGLVVYEKEADLIKIFNYFKPDVRFLGSDYATGENISEKNAVPIEIINSLNIHTSDIRERIKNDNK